MKNHNETSDKYKIIYNSLLFRCMLAITVCMAAEVCARQQHLTNILPVAAQVCTQISQPLQADYL
jgi:hypothetical protein